MILGLLPYRFRHGLVDFWGPGDADDGFGPGGTSGDMGASGGTVDNSGTGLGSGGYDGLGFGYDVAVNTPNPGISVDDAQKAVDEAKADAKAGKYGKVGGVLGGLLGLITEAGVIGGATIGSNIGKAIAGLSKDTSPENVAQTLGVDAKTAQSISSELSSMYDGERTEVLSQAATIVGEVTGVDIKAEIDKTEQPTRPIWDDFVNEFYGTGEYKVPDHYNQYVNGQGILPGFIGEGKRFETAQDFAKWVDSTPEADVKKLAADFGVTAADFTNAYNKGKGTNFTASTGKQWLGADQTMAGNQISNGSAKDLTYASANHMANAGLDYQSGIQGAMDNQSGVIDKLLSDSNQGTGLYNPVNFKFMGNNVSFVPKANRAQAAQQADFSQQSFNNTTSGLDKILASSQLTDPSNAGLKYLESLLKVSDAEENRSQNDITNALQKLNIEYGKEAADDKIKAGEASTLQKLGELFKVGTGIYEFGSNNDWWG